jgi:glycosyltransferase involved in cell wall biosynthesis
MKILYLHPRAWTGEYPMLVKLRQLGHEVCVLEELRKSDLASVGLADSFLNKGDGIETLWYNPHRERAKLLSWPVDRIFKSAFDGRNLGHRMLIIRRAALLFCPDVIVCTDGFTYAIPAAFLRRLTLISSPLVVSYIGGDILDCPEVGVGKRRTPMVDWLIRNSLAGIDRMRPLCDSLERILIRDGADPSRIEVIPIQLGVEIAVLHDIAGERGEIGRRVRQRYGIAPTAPLLVTLSGNHKGKGLHLLAQSWARIAKAIPGCRWLLCGPPDAWLEEGVWPILRESGHAADVCATGSLQGLEVYEHLAAGDLHVNPTICEGLNMVTVEAAAIGTPTVGTDGAGIADWMVRLNAGVVVPAGEAGLLADAIISLLDDPLRRSAMSLAGRDMASHFTLDRISSQLIRVFELAAQAARGLEP